MIVNVYRNRHLKQWSVKHGGKVVTRVPSITLKDVKFHVNEQASARIKEGGKRVVHAWARGEVRHDALLGETDDWFGDVCYSPFQGPYFYRRSTGKKVIEADLVVFLSNGRVLTGGAR